MELVESSVLLSEKDWVNVKEERFSQIRKRKAKTKKHSPYLYIPSPWLGGCGGKQRGPLMSSGEVEAVL